jgi:hypothetical protein
VLRDLVGAPADEVAVERARVGSPNAFLLRPRRLVPVRRDESWHFLSSEGFITTIGRPLAVTG